MPALAAVGGNTCYRFTDTARNQRQITVQLRGPSDADGPRPVVLFSHGGGPREACNFGNAEWGNALATAGYAVLHIAHSLTVSDLAYACRQIGVTSCTQTEAMLWLRPGDASAVIGQLAQIAEHFRMAGRLDAARVGMAGHSLGAYTTMVLAGARVNLGELLAHSFADPRIVSALALSPQGPDRFGFYDDPSQGHSWVEMPLPVLVQTGAGDTTSDLPEGEQALDRRIPFQRMVEPDKMEAYLDDPRADHNSFNLASAAPAEFHDWIRATAIAWFDATLQDRDAARVWLASDALVEVSAGLEVVSRKALTPP